MKALISPNENVESGYRVAETSLTSFEIAPPLFWINCDEEVVPDQFWYDPMDETIKPIPAPVAPVFEQPISQGTQTL